MYLRLEIRLLRFTLKCLLYDDHYVVTEKLILKPLIFQ